MRGRVKKMFSLVHITD